VDPHRFTPAGFQVLQPWGDDERPARMYVTAETPPPCHHESWAIAQVLPRTEGADIDEVLNQVHENIQENLHLEVVNFAESAVGLGLYRMRDSVVRDLLVNQHAHQLGNDRTVTFVRHDEGENFRSTVYTRLSWLMMLNLPMDYLNEEFLRDYVTKFGKMRGWIREDPTPARTLIRVAYGGTRDVPSHWLSESHRGMGGQWSHGQSQYIFCLMNQKMCCHQMSLLNHKMVTLIPSSLLVLFHHKRIGFPQ
jgi:translation elongation factor EF-1beta